MIKIVILAIILFILILCKNIYNIEQFGERPGYIVRRNDISRCPTYYCLMKTEDNCLDWCMKNVINEDEVEYCSYKCHELTRDMIDSLKYQYEIFGDSIYKFKGKTLHEYKNKIDNKI